MTGWLPGSTCPECGTDVNLYDKLREQMTDIVSYNAVIEGECSPVTFGEYWHIAPGDHAFAGPFTTKEAAQADALDYLQDNGGRYGIDAVKIVKTVSYGINTVTVETNFHDV